MPAPLNRQSLKGVFIYDITTPASNVVEIPYVGDFSTSVPYRRDPFLHRDTDGGFADLPASLGPPQPGNYAFTSSDIAYFNDSPASLAEVAPSRIVNYDQTFLDLMPTPVAGTTCEDQRPLYGMAFLWKNCDDNTEVYENHSRVVWDASGGKSFGEERNLINWNVQTLVPATYSTDPPWNTP